MMNKVITCTKCHASIPPKRFNTFYMTSCPSCGVALRIDVFPAFFKAIVPGQPGEVLLVENEASCFYHPQKKAVIPCESCGRFLCALCDVELNGQHLCPNCLQTGKKKGKLKSLENHRTLYDAIALRLAIYSMIFFWPNLIAAPIALFIAIRYRTAPSSIVSRTRIRSISAIVLSSLQILGWGMFFYYLLMA
jgi:hypothetical protein